MYYGLNVGTTSEFVNTGFDAIPLVARAKTWHSHLSSTRGSACKLRLGGGKCNKYRRSTSITVSSPAECACPMRRNPASVNSIIPSLWKMKSRPGSSTSRSIGDQSDLHRFAQQAAIRVEEDRQVAFRQYGQELSEPLGGTLIESAFPSDPLGAASPAGVWLTLPPPPDCLPRPSLRKMAARATRIKVPRRSDVIPRHKSGTARIA